MSAEYEVVRYRPELKDEVATFQTELWSSDAGRNRRYLEWKYEENPYLREPLIYLALHRGRVVGMRGFHGARLEAGTPTRAFSVLVGGDALIAPSHRDRGLVTLILKAAYTDLAGSESSYLLSSGASSRVNVVGMLAAGWKSVGPLRPIGRVTRQTMRRQRARQLIAGLPFFWRYHGARCLSSADERRPFRHLDAAASGRQRRAKSRVAIEREPRPDAMAELVGRLGHDGRIRHVRDGEYLRWRFQNPFSEYRFLYVGEDPLEGYLVLNRRTSDLENWRRVHIADLVANDIETRSELLSTAVTVGRFPELVTWTASLSEGERRLVTELGFAPVDVELTSHGCPCVLVRRLRDDLPETEWALGGRSLLDPQNWDWRVLYSMRG